MIEVPKMHKKTGKSKIKTVPETLSLLSCFLTESLFSHGFGEIGFSISG
jgi:hypothetical protein